MSRDTHKRLFKKKGQHIFIHRMMHIPQDIHSVFCAGKLEHLRCNHVTLIKNIMLAGNKRTVGQKASTELYNADVH